MRAASKRRAIPALLGSMLLASGLPAVASDVAPDPCLTATPSAELLVGLESSDPVDRVAAASELRRNAMCGAEADVAIGPLTEALSDPDPELRAAAAGTLHNFRRRALSASDELRIALADADPRVRAAAARALGKVDPHCARALLPALEDEDPTVRSATIFSLQFGMVDLDEVLPELDALLRDGNALQREGVLRVAVGNEAVAAALSVDTLLPILDEADPDQATRAAQVLAMKGARGPRAAEHFAELVETAETPMQRVRAIEQLGALGPAAGSQLGVLLAAMHDPEPRVRSSATFALRGLGPAAREAVPLIAEALLDHEDGFAELSALKGITEDHRAALPGLVHQLSSPEGLDRSMAAEMIATTGDAGTVAIPALIRALEEGDSGIAEIAFALASVGGDHPEVLAALREGTRSSNLNTSASCLRALEILGVDATETVAAWLEQLASDDPESRASGMANLRELAWEQRLDRELALEPLRRALADPDPEVRSSAAESIWMAWRDPQLSVPMLAAQLEDPDASVRDSALYPFSIGGLAAAAPDSLPLVVGRFRDSELRVRTHAIGTVWSFGPAAAPAVPELAALLSDPEEEVVHASCDALSDRSGRGRCAARARGGSLGQRPDDGRRGGCDPCHSDRERGHGPGERLTPSAPTR